MTGVLIHLFVCAEQNHSTCGFVSIELKMVISILFTSLKYSYKNFRNKKIYSKLVEYSLKKLKNLDTLLLWPNINNYKKKLRV